MHVLLAEGGCQFQLRGRRELKHLKLWPSASTHRVAAVGVPRLETNRAEVRHVAPWGDEVIVAQRLREHAN